MKTENGKIRVLQAIRQGQVGGGETHVLDLVQQMDKERFETEILSFTEGPMVDKLRNLGYTVHVISTLRPFDITVWTKVNALIRKGNFDIVHAHGTRAASNVFAATRFQKKIFLYTVHGWSFHSGQNPFVSFVRKQSENLLTRFTHLNITVSNSNKADGEKYFGMKNTRVVYNGINQEKFNPDANFADVRMELGIPHDKKLVGYLVRMTEQKDPLTMLYAIKRVIQKEKNVMFLMMGNGNLEKQVKDEAARLNLSEHIVFSDFRQDIPAVLKAIDIYCLPSLWEGMPIGILEAMAMGKPVVATGVDGTTELVSHKKNGLLVSVKNPKELADSILQLVRNPRVANSYGCSARQMIKENFSLEKCTNTIQNIYMEFVHAKNTASVAHIPAFSVQK